MGEKKVESTQQSSIGPRTGQENELMALLSRLGIDAEGQLGDLSGLASGEGLVPNASDRALVETSLQSSGDIARRQLEDFVRSQSLGLDESLSARGVQGSSIESVNRAVIGRDANRQFANFASGQAQQGAEALMQLPFQRAGVQLNANQALFQRLIGSINPALNFGLQERLGNQGMTGTETTSGFTTGEVLEAGAKGAGSAVGAAAGGG